MRIFYIDWQQHWECDRTMNIGDQQKSHKWQTSVDQLTVGFQWHRRCIELVFKSLDCFTKRLFHTATIFCCNICICCLKLHQADHKVEEFVFLPRFGGGALSSDVFTICAVYWSLCHRGYYGVSNVVLVYLVRGLWLCNTLYCSGNIVSPKWIHVVRLPIFFRVASQVRCKPWLITPC